MHALYVVSVWLHVLAAVTWIGGMFFLVLVVVPWVRKSGDRVLGAKLFRETGPRFRDVGWACFGVLLVTGTFQLWYRGVRFEHFARAEWLGSPFGLAVVLKLAVFALVLGASAAHDFVLGPRATLAVARDPRSPDAERMRRRASWLGRVNVLFALALVLFGVVIVRGWP